MGGELGITSNGSPIRSQGCDSLTEYLPSIVHNLWVLSQHQENPKINLRIWTLVQYLEMSWRSTVCSLHSGDLHAVLHTEGAGCQAGKEWGQDTHLKSALTWAPVVF
jgi:hypothetical protein